MNGTEAVRAEIRRYSVVLFWLLILGLLGLFFTNDFGLVDIHKTSIIVAVGVDSTENEVQLTAQLAVPKPSQSGDNVMYSEVQGSGETLADALNEINVKTGFYPQLQFCKLILLGDSCREKNIFRLLGCFYRKNYSELTALVAMCSGKAADMLAMTTETDDMTSTVISRALSDELKKTGNVSSVTLKDIAVANFSKSSACYMPFVEANKQGTSEEGGNGDNVGGEQPGGSGGQSGQGGGGGSGGQGESGGSQGGSGGSGSSGSSGGQSGGASSEPVEFTARRTAVFNGGRFAAMLDERQSFALNLLEFDISRALLPCDTSEYHYSLALREGAGGIGLSVEDGKPKLSLSFNAVAQIAGIKKPVDPKETTNDDKLSPDVIESARMEIEERMRSLVQVVKKTDCDFLGVKNKLYKYYTSYFGELGDDILPKMQIEYNINITSVN